MSRIATTDQDESVSAPEVDVVPVYAAPRLAVYTGVAIAVASLAFILLGDGLRDVLDPRSR